MKAKFKDVAHFYIGIECYDSFNDEKFMLNPSLFYSYSRRDSFNQIKPILKPMIDIDEDDFAEFCESELVGENEKLLFECSDKYVWRACSCSADEYPISMNVSPLIDEENENDCGNILMLHRPSMSISEGWLSNGETFLRCDTPTTARWIAFLCSRGYNVFGLDES